MSRHPFSRRKRRRIHAGRIKYYATYEDIPGEPDAFRVRWGPTDMPPRKKNKAAVHYQRRRIPGDPRRSPVAKRTYRYGPIPKLWSGPRDSFSMQQEYERAEVGRRLDETLKKYGLDDPPQYAPDEAGSDAGTSSLSFPH